MITAYIISFFIFGLIMGSFYNVVGLRIPKDESIVYPGSHCTACSHTLNWYELIPVVSYIFLRGKCKVCQSRVSPIYPAMELLTGLLFALGFWYFGFSWELAVAILFVSLLIIIVVSDIAYMLIPDKILLVFGLPLVVLRLIEPLSPWWDAFLGAAAGFSLLLLIAIISKGGMGGGDIKLYGVVGLVLGVKLTLLSFFLATFIGTVIGVLGIALKIWSRKQPVPFGPSIALGAVIAYFWGNDLIQLYLSLLNS